MSKIRVAIRNTYEVDFDEILSFVELKVSKKEARKAVRNEIEYLVNEWCERVMSAPDLTEEYLALYLCKEDLAVPKGRIPDRWEQILGTALRDRGDEDEAA